MTPSNTSTGATHPRRRDPRLVPAVRGLAGLVLAGISTTALLVGSVGSAQAATATPVLLGTAGTFSVLAGAGVTNTGPTTLAGDLGTFPTITITGTSSLTVGGATYAGGPVAEQAQADLVTAYGSAAGQGPASPVVGDLGGQTLLPGVHGSASSLALTGALTLDAGGDPSAVFVLQAGSTLTTASSSSVLLIGAAQACNVFWQVGSSATLGTASVLRGSVLALNSITLTTGATVEGRLLARNGAVVLDTNTVTQPSCATAAPPAAPATPTPSTTSAPTPSTTPSPAAPVATPTSGGTGPGVPGTMTGQVGEVPVGPVAAGDGSAAGLGRARSAGSSSLTLLGALGLVLALGLRSRRRTA